LWLWFIALNLIYVFQLSLLVYRWNDSCESGIIAKEILISQILISHTFLISKYKKKWIIKLIWLIFSYFFETESIWTNLLKFHPFSYDYQHNKVDYILFNCFFFIGLFNSKVPALLNTQSSYFGVILDWCSLMRRLDVCYNSFNIVFVVFPLILIWFAIWFREYVMLLNLTLIHLFDEV
jgi:hypothetical protein